MKNIIKILAALIGVLSFGLLAQASAAVVVTEISQSEYDDYVAENATAWQAGFKYGDASSDVSTVYSDAEFFSSSNSLILGQFDWNFLIDEYYETEIIYDGSGNLSVTVGLNTIQSQPVLGFNTILIKVVDSGSGISGTSYKNGIFGGDLGPIQDLVVDEGSIFYKVDLNLDSPEFTLTGDFFGDFSGASPDAGVTFTGINISSIPEPSISILGGVFILISLFRRVR